MKKNKLTLAIITLVSVATLAACSSSEDIVTMKGGKITVDDFYKDSKKSQTTQGDLRNMIIYRVAEDNYGDKVSKEDVNKEFKKNKKEFGKDFDAQLKQNGLDEASFKETIKKNLSLQEMLKAHIKVKDSALKGAWAAFHPEVEADIIQVQDEKEAKAVLKEIKDGKDFTKVAKEKSIHASKDAGGKVKFDSTDTTIPPEVLDAAFKLKDGAVSDVITGNESNGYQMTQSFYIVKMVKNQDKGNDMSKYKKQLKKIVEDQKLQDPEFQNKVIGKELKKADIDIKDDDMKGVLAGFIEEDKKDDKKDSKKSDKKDNKKEEKSEESK